jgi:hypothetical protein
VQSGRREHERQRHAVDEVDHAQAVRPLEDHAVFAGDVGELLLLDAPFSAALRESSGEDDDSADAAAAAGGNALKHAGARNREHGAIHSMRKRIDRRQAWRP